MSVLQWCSVACFAFCAIKQSDADVNMAKVEHITPLVLDLNSVQLFEGVSVKTAPVQFDHLGDGVKRSTGWAKPSMGFLALDHNGNGRIDNGSELFGQGTRLAS
jgi:hypothetical protein